MASILFTGAGCGGTSDGSGATTTGVTITATATSLPPVVHRATPPPSSTSTSATSTTMRRQGPTTSSSSSSSSTTTTAPPDDFLADHTVLPDHAYDSLRSGAANVNGQVFTRSLSIDPASDQPGYVELDLSRSADRLRGQVGISDESPADTVLRVEIMGDGWPVFSGDLRLGEPQPIDADVAGVLRLRVQVTDLSDRPGTGEAVLADVIVVPTR